MKKPMVWIISHFAGGPSYCFRLPDYNLAKYLKNNGYDVLIFASSALHNSDINFITDKTPFKCQEVDGIPFVYIRTRSYDNMKGESLCFIDYYRNLMKAYKSFDPPDLVIAAMPQPLSCLAGYRIAKKNECAIYFIHCGFVAIVHSGVCKIL